jgi:hypothetical protein
VVVRKFALVLGVSLGYAFSACGGSSEGGGSGDGTGGTAPNTCPPMLVNYGSGPGIQCAEPKGATCSDTEQFCICGAETIEGRPWHCVPTSEGCPAAPPGRPPGFR